jgi:hypothetical protein
MFLTLIITVACSENVIVLQGEPLDLVEVSLATGAVSGAATDGSLGVLVSVDGDIHWLGPGSTRTLRYASGSLLGAAVLEDMTLFGTDEGLFSWQDAVTVSPIDRELSRLEAVGGVGDEAFLMDDGVLRTWRRGQLADLVVDQRYVSGDFAARDGRAVVQTAQGVAVLERDQGWQVVQAEDADTVGVGLTDQAWWTDGRWVRREDGRSYKLSRRVDALLTGAQGVWAQSNGHLYWFTEDEAYRLEDGPRPLAVDGLGRLIASRDHELVRISHGRPVGVLGLRDGDVLDGDTPFSVIATGDGEITVDVDGAELDVTDGEGFVNPLDWADGQVHTLTARVDYDEGGSASASLSFTAISLEDVSWETDLLPIFEDNCQNCHGGAAETDLSTAAAWEARFEDILDNVESEAMPLGADPLSGQQRSLIRAWGEGGFQP